MGRCPFTKEKHEMLNWVHCRMHSNCIVLVLTHYRKGGYRVQRVRSRSTVPRADRLTEAPIETRDPTEITLLRTRRVTPSDEQMSASRARGMCVESQPERVQLRTAGYSERAGLQGLALSRVADISWCRKTSWK